MRKRVMILLLLADFCLVANAECPQFQSGSQVGTVAHSSLDEISGIAASRKNADVFWVHNDHKGSTYAPEVFALTSSGKHLGVYTLDSADDEDYEDIAIGPGPTPQRYAPNEIIVKFRHPDADTVEKQVKFAKSAAELTLSQELDQVTASYRVKQIKPLFKNFKKDRQRLKALRKKDEALLTKNEKHILRRLKRAPKDAKIPDLSRIFKIQVDLGPGQSLEEVVEAYRNNPNVEYAELNYIVSIDLTPDDPLFPIQWPLHNTGQMYPESGKCNPPPGIPDCDIDAPEAWDIHTGSPEVIVAVVDTGVDYNHRDLQGNMWTDSNGYYGYDFFNDDNDPMDDNGHGTHCAGIIAADGNNGLDIAGLCWSAKIMAVKFLGESAGGYESGAVSAIYYAVENGADVISNSWGGDDYSETLEQAVAYAHSQGVIVVAAAGNGNWTLPRYPARYDHVISVAATDSNDQRAYCSNCCSQWASNYGNLVDIAAPGVDILSLRAEGTSEGTPYDDYTTIMSGTSMACPHVSGACALMLSRYPQIQVDELEQHLLASTDAISPEICASGRLNVYEAMLRIPGAKGIVLLDSDFYSCSGLIGIKLLDLDLKENGTQQVIVFTGGPDWETVILTEMVPPIDIFTGTISTASGDPSPEDGTLQVSHGQIIAVVYYDADDGTGNPASTYDLADVDCEAPTIFNVQVQTRGIAARITFETNEPTMGRVRCGQLCGGPYTAVNDNPTLATAHTIQLNGLPSQTTCYFVVDANDAVGNQTTDDNSGVCYSFATSTPIVFNVPAEFITIQAAIDEAWSDWGDTVLVAEGTYYENINLNGKNITLWSTDPNDPAVVEATIIDGNDVNSVVTFAGTESSSCVLSGFTITNGQVISGSGAGINGNGTMATIQNNIISGNELVSWAGPHGGGCGISDCDGLIQDNIIVDNDGGMGHGGGLHLCDGTICNNIISYNGCYWGGGLSCCHGPILNNLLVGNGAVDGGAFASCHGSISNCTLVGNYASYGSGIYECYGSISNCIIWQNGAGIREQIENCSTPVYSCIEDWNDTGIGNISTDPCFVSMGYWQDMGTYWQWVDDGSDYHLQSEVGRWDPNQNQWVTDANTSLCIDAGDLNSDWTAELWPHGKRINMGAFGGTPQASMSPSSVGNIADLNNDDLVDYTDLKSLTDIWLCEDVLLSEDLDRNGIVDFVDYGIFAQNWLWQE